MASAYHHIGLQVSDLDRAAAFYIDVLDGHWLTMPILMDDEAAAEVMDGPPGTRFRHCKIGFDPGVVELFEFVGPNVPAWTEGRAWLRLPHFSIVVDDVRATLRLVEQAGGRRLWPEIRAWARPARLCLRSRRKRLRADRRSDRRGGEDDDRVYPDAKPPSAARRETGR